MLAIIKPKMLWTKFELAVITHFSFKINIYQQCISVQPHVINNNMYEKLQQFEIAHVRKLNSNLGYAIKPCCSQDRLVRWQDTDHIFFKTETKIKIGFF